MPCQREIFEVCPECVPPEEYTRISKMRDRALTLAEPVTTERRYSLVEIQEMMRQWLGESSDIHGTEELVLAFRLSMFIEWMKKREREVGDG